MGAQRSHGNQWGSPKAQLLDLLDLARRMLNEHQPGLARFYLIVWGTRYAEIPASTRRRWRCGQ